MLMKYSLLLEQLNYTHLVEVITVHVRYINIVACTRGFPSQNCLFYSFFCLSIPKKDMDT